MASTLSDLDRAISQDLEQFQNQVEIFINELKNAATADPFSSVGDDRPTSRVFIRTGGAGSTFYDALQSLPERPSSMSYVKPTNPGSAPASFNIDDVTLPTIPNFADAAPKISFPSPPSSVLPTAPAAPTVDTVNVPGKPTLSLPSVPVLSAVALPDAPTLTIPTFDEVFPDTPDIVLTQETFEYGEGDFSDALLTRIKAILQGDLDNGGYGITTADEEAAYSRGIDRAVQEGQRRERELADRFAQRGHRAPPGALATLEQQSIEQTMRQIADMNREVVVSRAELYRRAREFALSQGTTVVEMLIRDWGFKQERVLNAARFAAEFSINVVDARVRIHNLKVQAFEGYARAYETKIRALLAQVDIFRTQVEAARTEQAINESVVNVYEAQVRAANTVIALYNAELDAARTQTELEKLKLEQYQTATQAFVAQLQAKSEEMRLFESRVRAEGIKQDLYQSQVQAYATRVQAAKSEADIQLARIQAQVQEASLELEGYKTAVAKYEVDLKAEADRVKSLVDVYGADVDAFRAVLGGWEGLARVDELASEALTRELQVEERLEVERLQIRINEILERTRIKLAATQSGAEVYRDMLAALNSSRNMLISKEET